VTEEPSTHDVSFREAARFWTKLGFISFGGPAGQIAVMHEEIVDRRKWVSNSRFLHALNFCMLLPGPEAQQLAIYLGWLLHRIKGGLLAGVMFVLPSAFIMFGLSWLFAVHSDVTWVNALFAGLAPAVIALVAWATIRIGTKALANRLMLGSRSPRSSRSSSCTSPSRSSSSRRWPSGSSAEPFGPTCSTWAWRRSSKSKSGLRFVTMPRGHRIRSRTAHVR
jgi:chromate transport protein ChrA